MGKVTKQRDHLIALVNQLEVALYEPLYDQEYFDQGHWDYVAYGIPEFMAHLHEIHLLTDRADNLKFIDVGCGIGTKVALASLYFDSYGVELNEDYAKVAKKITKPKKFWQYGRYEANKDREKRIFVHDALKFNYADYDVIYYFRPMHDDKMQTALETRIWKQAKPGTFVVPIYAISSFPRFARHLPTPAGHLWVKGQNKKLVQKCKQLFGNV